MRVQLLIELRNVFYFGVLTRMPRLLRVRALKSKSYNRGTTTATYPVTLGMMHTTLTRTP
jgi:hypothetical protein